MRITHLFILAVATFIWTGCQTKKESKDTPGSEPVAQIAGKAHNARNSLDYRGIYVGELPTTSGSGMTVTLSITENTYHKKIQYKENQEAIESEGKYSWNEEGNTITLEGEDKPNAYFVGENRLFSLDMNNNRITGDLADQYILHKTE